jgi:hypothetical protein
MPYNMQHIYWWAFPPLLLPVYFHADNMRYVIQHRQWWDLFWIGTYVDRRLAPARLAGVCEHPLTCVAHLSP